MSSAARSASEALEIDVPKASPVFPESEECGRLRRSNTRSLAGASRCVTTLGAVFLSVVLL